MRFVLASHNKKKLDELSAILGGLGIEVVALPDDAPEPAEDGTTFEENARIKALAAHAHTGLPAIADDSGLEVDALGGAPGVYSARYCPGTDNDRTCSCSRIWSTSTSASDRHGLCAQSAACCPTDRKSTCAASARVRS